MTTTLTRRTRTLVPIALAALAAVALVAMVLASAAPAVAQSQSLAVQQAPRPVPFAYVIARGDDGWKTPSDNSTWAEFNAVSLPGGCGVTDGTLNGFVYFKGSPLPSSNPNGMGGIDTIVRRTQKTVALAIGDTDRVNLLIKGLSLISTGPTSVSCASGSVSYDVSAHLSAYGQAVGFMDITRDDDDGGAFSSELFVTPKFYFYPTAGGPAIELDCGDPAVDCGIEEQLHFASSGTPWTLVGGPGGYDPGANGVNTVPPNTYFDSDGNGSLDTLAIGASNLTAGIDPNDWQTAARIRELEILMSPEHSGEPDEEEPDVEVEPHEEPTETTQHSF